MVTLSAPKIRQYEGMCNPAGIDFGRRYLSSARVAGKDVLEVGSFYGSGPSLRPYVEAHRPATYLGVDIQTGPGVDRICRVEELRQQFGSQAFDAVIATELVEHVRDWREAIRNLKAVLRLGGALILTTRSVGYPYHGAPFDFWRYGIEDMASIFADMNVLSIESDPSMPGVFVAVEKEHDRSFANLDRVQLYAVATGRRQYAVSTWDIYVHRLKSPRRMAASILPMPVKKGIRRWLNARKRGG